MRKNGAHFYLAMAIQIKIWVAGTVDRQGGGYFTPKFWLKSKLYIPSTLNIALLQLHTHLNVCAVK